MADVTCPMGMLSPLASKRLSPPRSNEMGCFHGIKLSLGKWTLLISSNIKTLLGIFLNSVDY